jgi:subtilisin family serine protease
MPDTPRRLFTDLDLENLARPDDNDRRAVRAQVASLASGPAPRSVVLQRHRRLIERRAGRRAGLAPARVLDEFVDDTGQPLLSGQEIVVRAADLDSQDAASPFGMAPMSTLLAEFGQFDRQPVAGLEGRVVLLTQQGLRASDGASIVDRLLQAGYQASLNQVTPLGYLTKSAPGVGPEPTKRTVPFPPEQPPQRDIAVTVIDTGIAVQNRDDRWLDGVSGEPDPLYEFDPTPVNGLGQLDLSAGHGTFVAGVIRRVAPHATVSVRRAIFLDGIGFDVDVAEALVAAYEDGAELINLSLGTETLRDQPPLATLVALEIISERLAREPDRDVVVVAAAGNNASSRPVFPAAFGAVPTVTVPVVAVGALTEEFAPSSFSTRGWWLTCSTPGEGVLSTFVTGRESPELDPQPDTFTGRNPWAVWSGTSFAAPQVTGAIARRCQQTGEPPSEALAWLLTQGVPVPDFGVALRIL